MTDDLIPCAIHLFIPCTFVLQVHRGPPCQGLCQWHRHLEDGGAVGGGSRTRAEAGEVDEGREGQKRACSVPLGSTGLEIEEARE